MSFPNLLITGSVVKRTITGIGVQYDNNVGEIKPARLTRDKYEVQNQTKISNISGGTPLRWPDVAYSDARAHHKWVGYIDVLTQSVSDYPNASQQAQDNLSIMKSAMILDMPYGPEHTVRDLALFERGPLNPSLGGSTVEARDEGRDWVFYQDSAERLTTSQWFIRGISIQNRNDNTTRVSFNLEIVEPWNSIKTLLQD